MKGALAALVLALLAAALWFVLSRGTAPLTPQLESAEIRTPIQKAERVDSAGKAETTRTSESRDEAAARPLLRVRSSAGIPLAFVEVRGPETWRRVVLTDGSCDPGSLAAPMDLRAPGHLTQRIESLAPEIVLEPDALMVIRSATLRACLDRVVPDEAMCRSDGEFGDARERAISHGWISDHEYGVAWAYERLEPLPREQDLSVVRADGREFHLMLAEHPGLRASWDLPCGDLATHSALEVTIRRTSQERGPVRLMLNSPRIDFSTPPPPEYAFGTVARSGDLYEERELGPDADTVRFDRALVGRNHVLTATDTKTQYYGRIAFVHDGSGRTLEMRAPLEARGRVVDARTRTPLQSYSALIKDSGDTGWFLEAHSQSTGEGGSIRMTGPARVLANERMPLDPPTHWLASFASPGYEDARLEFDLAAPRLLDLGEVALQRRENSIVLAPGSGIGAQDLGGHYVVFADEPSIGWGTLQGHLLPDGELEVELWRLEDNARSQRTDLANSSEAWVEFTRDLGTRLLVRVSNDARTFQLGSDRRYHPVPEDSLELTLRTESLPSRGPEWQRAWSWQIGWTWDGAWICVGQLASRVVGNEKKVRITVPHGAQTLWWSSTGIPPDLHGDPGGTQAIQGTSMTVVLR